MVAVRPRQAPPNPNGGNPQNGNNNGQNGQNAQNGGNGQQNGQNNNDKDKDKNKQDQTPTPTTITKAASGTPGASGTGFGLPGANVFQTTYESDFPTGTAKKPLITGGRGYVVIKDHKLGDNMVLFAICLCAFFLFFFTFLKWNTWHERRTAKQAVDHMITAETRWAEGPIVPEKAGLGLGGRDVRVNPNLPSNRPRTPSPLADSRSTASHSQTQAQEYRQQYGMYLYPPGSGPNSPVHTPSRQLSNNSYASGPTYSPPSPNLNAPRRKPPPRPLADEGSRASSPLSSTSHGRW